MKFWPLFLILWASQALALSWQDKLKELLPDKLKFLTLQKTTLAEVESQIGKPALVRDNRYYWVYQGFEYALELKVKDKVIQSLHFTFPKQGPSVDALRLDPANYKASSLAGSRYMDYHDVGGSISIDLATQSISVIRIR